MEDWKEEMLEKIRLQGLQLAELQKTVNRLTKPRKHVAKEFHPTFPPPYNVNYNLT